jgi:hypothetical protein
MNSLEKNQKGDNQVIFFINFRIRIASHAAFSPLSTPTHATGTPFGICAIARSASSPLSVPLTATPITGLSVFEAITPGRAAERPAIAMKIFALLVLMKASSLSGSRWADMIRASYVIVFSSRIFFTLSVIAESDAEPESGYHGLSPPFQIVDISHRHQENEAKSERRSVAHAGKLCQQGH